MSTTQTLREPKAQRLRNNPMPQNPIPQNIVEAGAERYAAKQKWKATPQEAQAFMDICYGCLEGLTDEEFEQIKLERVLRK